MADIVANLKWCMDPANGVANEAHYEIAHGRYVANYAPQVKEGYHICEKGQNADQDTDFCDEGSFYAAAVMAFPESDRGKYLPNSPGSGGVVPGPPDACPGPHCGVPPDPTPVPGPG